MLLAQAASGSINSGTGTSGTVQGAITTGSTFLGVTPTGWVIGLIVLAVIVLIAWALLGRGDSDYYRRERVAGAKGGRVRRVIREYDDDDDVEEEVL